MLEWFAYAGDVSREVGNGGAAVGMYHAPIPEMAPFSSAPKKPNSSPSTKNEPLPPTPHGPNFRPVLNVKPMLVMLLLVAFPNMLIICA
jgi:hypothetical protein